MRGQIFLPACHKGCRQKGLTLKIVFSETLRQLLQWEQGQIWHCCTDAGGKGTLISPNNRVRCLLKDTNKGGETIFRFIPSTLRKGISVFDDSVPRHAGAFSVGTLIYRVVVCEDRRHALGG